ncbi:MAG: hypothetical protein JW857_09365 [Bacteroidales bacterium]|nr:hypothetical protein [Bacteroidales bacterium]
MKTRSFSAVLKLSFSALFLFILFQGCKKETVTPVNNEAPELTQKVNKFIKESMEDAYLWEKYLPNIDTKYEFDSKAYFDKLLYEEDKWSFITDDIAALEASFQGVETSFGYSLAFYWRDSNRTSIIAYVEYVYPNSPADEADIKRGDIILKLSGADITLTNYLDLLYGSTISITLGVSNNNVLSEGASLSLTSLLLNLNPVLKTTIIEEAGRKIGYLFYTQYISDYNDRLDLAFQEFKSQGITDLVLDIRYNPGGYMSAAQHLCSLIAPQSTVDAEDVLVTLQWNDFYQNYWQSHGVYNQIQMNFDPTVPVNLDLDKIYILTGNGSASASELTITGLDAYMDVVLIGDTTYGKYTGSITLKPEDIYTEASYYADIDNWGLQPIVLRYANANGVTDFKNGFAPDIRVLDNVQSGIPLGDPTEPLFAAALQEITGISKSSGLKKQRISSEERITRGFSRFDKQKRNLIFETPKPEHK